MDFYSSRWIISVSDVKTTVRCICKMEKERCLNNYYGANSTWHFQIRSQQIKYIQLYIKKVSNVRLFLHLPVCLMFVAVTILFFPFSSRTASRTPYTMPAGSR